MASIEDSSYAVASWQRFENTLTNDLMRAMTSAFALVATADGDLATDEVARFAELLRKQSLPLATLSPQEVERAFTDAVTALLSDPGGSRQRALANVASVKHNSTECKIVMAVANVAVHADHQSRSTEEHAMGDIQTALGLTA